MTAAGLWGLYTIQEGLDEGIDWRVNLAWAWINNHYYIDQNYGIKPYPTRLLYYYLYSLAKAAILWGRDTIKEKDWYDDMSKYLISVQQEDGDGNGYWLGTDGDEPDLVATCWALLALETKLDLQGRALEVAVQSPVDLHLYDPEGRHVGIDYDTGEVEIGIPGATYSGSETEPQVIRIADPTAGSYRIVLVGRETGSYALTIRGYVRESVVSETTFSDKVIEGEIIESPLTLSAIAGPMTIDIRPPELARSLKEDAIEGLNYAKTGDKLLDKDIDQIVKQITRSLSPKLWVDDSHLDAKQGMKVFKEEVMAVTLLRGSVMVLEKSIPLLEKIIKEKQDKGQDASKEEAKLRTIINVLPAFEEAIAKLVKADEKLARVAIVDAENMPVNDLDNQEMVDQEIAKAKEEFDKAKEKSTENESIKALSNYGEAWSHAQLAIKLAQR